MMTTLAEIIAKAGGAAAISREAGGKPTLWAVYKWTRSGIPRRHWPLVMRLAGISAEMMFAAHCESSLPTPANDPVAPAQEDAA